MAEATGDFGLRWELLVADTWDDPALKKRLLDDPATVLKERGIAVPEGISVNVVADDESTVHLVLPVKPGEYDLSEEELESVAGGGRRVNYCTGNFASRRCSPQWKQEIVDRRDAHERWLKNYQREPILKLCR